MLILAAVLIIVSLLILAGGAIWLLIEAFHESLAWGLCVLLVPLANLVFCFARWQRAKGPFLCHLLAILLLLGSYSVVCGFQRKGGKLPDLAHLSLFRQAPPERSGVADSGMFKAEKDAQLQIKLVNLHTGETELLQRKAELAPGDRVGAAKLADDIKKYNADLQPVLQTQAKAGTPAK